jgi:hypothetical protein
MRAPLTNLSQPDMAHDTSLLQQTISRIGARVLSNNATAAMNRVINEQFTTTKSLLERLNNT